MCNNFDPAIAGLDCCHFNNPFTDSKRICCDGSCCRRYDEERRDCFWPEFSHPEWLCCRILYGCDPAPRDTRCDPDDDDDDDRRCRRHRCCHD